MSDDTEQPDLAQPEHEPEIEQDIELRIEALERRVTVLEELINHWRTYIEAFVKANPHLG